MKLNIRNITAVLLGLLLSVIMFTPTALAAKNSTVQLPVMITEKYASDDYKEVYVVRMTANDAENPMPNGKLGGSYDLRIDGAVDAVFPAIEFKGVGIYTYTVEQIPGKNKDCKYDTRIYTVKISVTNAQVGEYDVTVTLREGDMGEKPAAVVFRNVYKKDDIPPHKPDEPYEPIVRTGVNDNWMFYLIGSVVLMILSGFIIKLLRRKEDE